jgi:hypothetical protein
MHIWTHCATFGALDRTKPLENGGRTARVSEYASSRPLLGRIIENTEIPMSTGTASVNDAFRNTFVIKTVNLFSRNLVLQQRRADMNTIGNP